MKLASFWELVDESKLEAQFGADGRLQALREISLEDLGTIGLQYRYFVQEYPNHLGFLVARLPYGQLKSLVAATLSEELGCGDPAKAHLQLWDRFLLSIGVPEDSLEGPCLNSNLKLVEKTKEVVVEGPLQQGVGLVGMGIECICQIYLSVMYRYLQENPRLDEPSIDWEFWDFHVGEPDIAHRQLFRQVIGSTVGEQVEELATGYQLARQTWDAFWDNTLALVQLN